MKEETKTLARLQARSRDFDLGIYREVRIENAPDAGPVTSVPLGFNPEQRRLRENLDAPTIRKRDRDPIGKAVEPLHGAAKECPLEERIHLAPGEPEIQILPRRADGAILACDVNGFHLGHGGEPTT